MEPQQMEVSGVTTLSDLIRYQYFHSYRGTWPLIAMMAVVFCIMIPAAVLLLLFSIGKDDFGAQLSNSVPFICMASLWSLLMFGMPYWNARTMYRTQPALSQRITYSFGPEGYSISGAGFAGTIDWSAMHRVVETKSLFVLYQAPNMANVLPKHFFATPESIGHWKTLVQSVFAKGISGSGVPGRFC